MHLPVVSTSLIALLVTSAYAGSIRQHPPPLPNFLLVTTSQSTSEIKSSELANVNATSLWDPNQQNNFLLRLIGPGYESLPRFNFKNAGLHTLSEGIEGTGPFVYNSLSVQEGGELQFLRSKQDKGNLGLRGGWLLTVDDEHTGWTICEDEFGEQIFWKGTGPSCTDTYIQAVQVAPY